MKIQNNFENKTLEEITEALSKPKANGMTFGELAQMVSVFERLASVQSKIQNPQSGFEAELQDLKRRVKALEDKVNAIFKAFTGGDGYGD